MHFGCKHIPPDFTPARLIGLSQTNEATAESVRQIIGPCHLYMAIYIHSMDTLQHHLSCRSIQLSATPSSRQQPPPPNRCLPSCGGPTPHHLCVSTGTCSTCSATNLNRLRQRRVTLTNLTSTVRQEEGRERLLKESMMRWGREQATSEDRRSTTRSWTWRLWRSDSMRPWRAPLLRLKTKQWRRVWLWEHMNPLAYYV